eukprot:6082278-Amphidinium_carterae.1
MKVWSADTYSGWTDLQLPVADGPKWLRQILLDMSHSSESTSNVSSHSLKTTLLSYAKWGMSLENRSIMGHHLDPSCRSPLTYSREAITSIHLEVHKMIKDIGIGRFNSAIKAC